MIGVGGGGGNAVNHMYRQGIKDVDFAVCNTDAQALMNSPVPYKVQLGSELTEGRGAGNKPDVGRESAIENIKDIEKLLGGNTKMVFITNTLLLIENIMSQTGVHLFGFLSVLKEQIYVLMLV